MILAIFLAVAPCYGEQSAELSDDALITDAPGHLLAILVMTDGTNAATIDVYDNNAAAASDVLIPTWTVTTSATDRAQYISFGKGIVRYRKGLYVDVTCAGTVSYMVYYDPISE